MSSPTVTQTPLSLPRRKTSHRDGLQGQPFQQAARLGQEFLCSLLFLSLVLSALRTRGLGILGITSSGIGFRLPRAFPAYAPSSLATTYRTSIRVLRLFRKATALTPSPLTALSGLLLELGGWAVRLPVVGTAAVPTPTRARNLTKLVKHVTCFAKLTTCGHKELAVSFRVLGLRLSAPFALG